jgi:predicted transcriptional regulator
MIKTAVLMSIKPAYADMIFQGRKTIELRRVCPKICKGDIVLVYVSGPRMALVGGFEVEGVVCESPSKLREHHLHSSGVSKVIFDAYFSDSQTAYGIQIGRTWQFDKPAELHALRKRKGGFRPPQSYRYIRNGEFKSLIS